MTTRLQIYRSSNPGALPPGGSRLPGEMWCNFADLNLGVIDELRNPQKLVAVRFFSALAVYDAGDIVVQFGNIWTANASISPGPFNSAQWTAITSIGVIDGPAGTPRVIYGMTSGVARWGLYLGDGMAEAGGNLGSDFGINAYDDAGDYLQTILLVNRKTALTVLNGVGATQWNRIGPEGSSTIVLNKAPGATASNIGGAANGVLRWNFLLGDGSAETGGNAGSDFSLGSYDDAGNPLSTPLRIQRLTGHMVINANNALMPGLQPPAMIGNAILSLNKAAGASASGLNGLVNGHLRWQVVPGNAAIESGGNIGSNFAITSYDDNAALIGSPLVIGRYDSVVAINGNGAMPGNLSAPLGSALLTMNKAGPSGQGNGFYATTNGSQRWRFWLGDGVPEGVGNAGSGFSLAAFDNSGTMLSTPLAINRATATATFAVPIVNGPSDRTLKENIAPITGALDKVKALQGVTFNMIETPGKPEIGLIAQDVEEVVPEVVQDFQTYDSEGMPGDMKLSLEYPRLVALLIEAVKTLEARVAVLEGATA